jgi:hypothetical protein
MLSFLIGLATSFFPEGWRKRWFSSIDVNPTSSAVVTGVAQFLACIAWLGWHYPAFVRSQMNGAVGNATMGAMEKGGETAAMGLGPLLLVAYLIQPFSMVLVYFMFEGGIRIIAAVTTHETVPTLPLFLASLLDARAREYRRERALGPRVVDVAQMEGASDLLVASCRPKAWTALTTIRYQDVLYEVAKSNQGAKPRPYLYLLRKIPPHKLVRGVHDYSPDEVLPEKERAQAAMAGKPQ